jgi:L-alanine-DL-glutamate epimerase-like enolase superfamily enzyme
VIIIASCSTATHLNDKPGFGVEINWDYARRYAA